MTYRTDFRVAIVFLAFTVMGCIASLQSAGSDAIYRPTALTAEASTSTVSSPDARNYDLSNLTIIEGDTGLIIADPLISAETAAAALELYYAYRPRKPVVAVIYSHSHIDHYGGVAGLISQTDVDAGNVTAYAPDISKVVNFLLLLDRDFNFWFNIVTP